jgi:ABC-2 type transport system permease protein
MRDVLRPLRVVRYSAANAWADMWVIFSPTSWILGWLSRVLMQVLFFALVGMMLESPDAIRFLFIGNAVMLVAIEAMLSVSTTAWERRQGTFPLLVAAPTALWPVFVGRSLQWLPTGVATSSVALFALGPFFGVTWTPGSAAAAVGCLMAVAAAMYCFALALSALVLSVVHFSNVIGNAVNGLMMLGCGVMVPLQFWPGWVQATAKLVPLTHGLGSVRTLADGPIAPDGAAAVARGVLLTLGVGGVWLIVAAGLFSVLAAVGRRTGSIEFAD